MPSVQSWPSSVITRARPSRASKPSPPRRFGVALGVPKAKSSGQKSTTRTLGSATIAAAVGCSPYVEPSTPHARPARHPLVKTRSGFSGEVGPRSNRRFAWKVAHLPRTRRRARRSGRQRWAGLESRIARLLAIVCLLVDRSPARNRPLSRTARCAPAAAAIPSPCAADPVPSPPFARDRTRTRAVGPRRAPGGPPRARARASARIRDVPPRGPRGCESVGSKRKNVCSRASARNSSP